MSRTTVFVNTSVALVLLAAAVGFTAPELSDQGGAGAAAQRPPATDPGESVTLTGNLDAPRTVGLPFAGQPGLVTAVRVGVGDSVDPGEVLAEVDARRARSQIRHAKATIRSAKASLRITTEGPTAARRANNDASIAVAIQELGNAQQAVAQARETFRRRATEQSALVAAAANRLRAAQRDVSRTASATVSRTRVTPIVPPGPTVEVANSTRSASVAASTLRSSVAAAGATLVAAEEQRQSTLLAQQQAIRTLRNQATLAARNLQLARTAAALGAESGTAGEVEAARAQIDEARAQLIDARQALVDTRLRAPFRGTVVDIAGGVGETPVGAVRGSSTPGAGGPGSAENRNPATPSGFVILADLTNKSVTARVVEAEVGKIAVGQTAAVTFPATGAEVPGRVRAIDPQENVIGNVIAYNVAVTLDAVAATLRLGQSASVRILTGQERPSLVVPNEAVMRVGDQAVVQVRRGGRAVKIPVTTEPAGPSTTRIRSPLLLPDDEVVVPDRTPARREDTEPTPAG